MTTYTAPVRDFQFALREWLNIEQYSEKGLKGFEDLSYLDAILEEGAKFNEEIIHPLNVVGDEQGLKLEKGEDGFNKGASRFQVGFGVVIFNHFHHVYPKYHISKFIFMRI